MPKAIGRKVAAAFARGGRGGDFSDMAVSVISGLGTMGRRGRRGARAVANPGYGLGNAFAVGSAGASSTRRVDAGMMRRAGLAQRSIQRRGVRRAAYMGAGGMGMIKADQARRASGVTGLTGRASGTSGMYMY